MKVDSANRGNRTKNCEVAGRAVHLLDARLVVFLLVGCISLVGAAAVVIATRWGPGTSPDSVAYITAARSIAAGNGLSQLSVSGVFQPMVRWPPLYPFALSFSHFLGADPLAGSRYLNALLFGLNIFVVGLIIWRSTHGSRAATVVGGLILLASAPILLVHSMVYSEPLFYLLCLGSLLLLSLYIEKRHLLLLAATCAVASLAPLTRYVGVSVVLTGGAGILLWSNRRWKRRVLNAAALTVIGLLPISLWLLRNRLSSGTATERQIAFHPPTLRDFKTALYTIRDWAFPFLGNIRNAYTAAFAIFIFSCLAALGILMFIMIRRNRIAGGAGPRDGIPVIIKLLLLFCAVYAAALLFTLSFVDAYTPFDSRVLSPLYVAGIILLVFLAQRLYAQARLSGHRGALQIAAVTITVVLVAFLSLATVQYVVKINKNGSGYAKKVWRESEAMEAVAALPPGAIIYTNGPDAVYLLTGRTTRMLPVRKDMSSLKRNDKYVSELQEMIKTMRREKAYLAYFDTINWRAYLPTDSDIRGLPVRSLGEFQDGTIYIHDPSWTKDG